MAKSVDELQVWQRAVEFNVAVNAISENAGFQRDRRLQGQLLDATDSVVSNIAEGFEQSTDRGFAKYLYTAKVATDETAVLVQVTNDYD